MADDVIYHTQNVNDRSVIQNPMNSKWCPAYLVEGVEITIGEPDYEFAYYAYDFYPDLQSNGVPIELDNLQDAEQFNIIHKEQGRKAAMDWYKIFKEGKKCN